MSIFHMSPTSFNDLINNDLKYIWHPCAQMKDFTEAPPLIINSAKGSYLYTEQGPIIDAISSWWCKSLGHRHPKIIAALKKQLLSFEHVITANTTNKTLVDLGISLAKITKKQHVFFASDGSSAVEIALKLALHANLLKGFSEKKEFIALKNSYHGETLATLSISDLAIYKKPYQNKGPICHFIDQVPYVNNSMDPLWNNASDYWIKVVPQLEKIKDKICAIIVEPLLQGAGGMLCYSADFLKRLAVFAKENDILLIADEIMTGIGRTGKWLACQHAGVEPDLICLSKGLTGGAVPFSCVSVDHKIFELFYDDYQTGKSFLHSHTYSGNALGIAAALATLKIIEEEKLIARAEVLGSFMYNKMKELAEKSGLLKNVRYLGAVVAADFVLANKPRVDFAFYKEALKLGALIRPLGNTLYWLPPLNTSFETIEKLSKITLKALTNVAKAIN